MVSHWHHVGTVISQALGGFVTDHNSVLRKLAACLALACASVAPAAATVVAPALSVSAWTGSSYTGHLDFAVESYEEGGVTKYRVGTESAPATWTIAGDFEVKLSATLDPDPSIGAAIAVTDFGAPTNFSFSWSTPIMPTGPDVLVRSFISGSLSDLAGDGVAFVPTHASGKALVSTLNGGSPTMAIGPALGVAGTGSPAAYGYAYASAGYPSFLPGPSGMWTSLEMALGFGLGGGEDSAAFTLYSEVAAVPLPAGAVLLLGGLLSLAPFARRGLRAA
jgi:hypothetical protein